MRSLLCIGLIFVLSFLVAPPAVAQFTIASPRCTIAAGDNQVHTEGGSCGVAVQGAQVTLTDATSASDCGTAAGGSSGGGTVPSVCIYNSTTGVLYAVSGGAGGGVGDVVGPGSATDDEYACFDGTTGKLIQECTFGEGVLMKNTDYDSDTNNAADFADSLKVDPTDCTGNEFSQGINATGVAQCSELPLASFEVCRSGTVKGFGYDASSGLYSVTCGNYNWHGDLDGTQTTASYFVNCTGDGAPDGACTRNGERILRGALHRLGVALQYTQPGGKALLPIFDGKDHGIYVDDGAGTLSDGVTRAKFPPANQWWLENLYPTAYAAHGPVSRLQVIQAMFGVEIVFEQLGSLEESRDPSCTADFDDVSAQPVELFTCNDITRRGVWLLNDRGNVDGAAGPGGPTLDGPSEDIATQSFTFTLGGSRQHSFCDTTANDDPTCLTTKGTADQPRQFQPSWVIGGKATIGYASTKSALFCVDNSIGGTLDREANAATCSLAPMIGCWDSSGNPDVVRSSGGCNFGGGDTFGTCIGFVDQLENLRETTGRDPLLYMEITHCIEEANDDPTCEGAFGTSGFIANYRSAGPNGSCPSGHDSLRLGTMAGNGDGSPYTVIPLAANRSGSYRVYATYPHIISTAGGGWRNAAFMPANWLGRKAGDAFATGQTDSSGALTTMSIESLDTGATPTTNSWQAFTLIVHDSTGGDKAYRTINSNTATTVTFTDSVTFVATDQFTISRYSCLANLDASGAWLNNAHDEKACDTQTMLGALAGVGRNDGMDNARFAYLSQAQGVKSSIDGWRAIAVRYNNLEIFHQLRHAIFDISAFSMEGLTIYSGRQKAYNALFSVFTNDSTVENFYVFNWGGQLLTMGQYVQNFHLRNGVVHGIDTGGAPVMSIRSGLNATIEDVYLSGADHYNAAIIQVRPGVDSGNLGQGDVRNLTLRRIHAKSSGLSTGKGPLLSIENDGEPATVVSNVGEEWYCSGSKTPYSCCTGVDAGTCPQQTLRHLRAENLSYAVDSGPVCAVTLQRNDTDEIMEEWWNTIELRNIMITQTDPSIVTKGLCVGCLDLYDTGGPPQTSGRSDGLCDSDGSTNVIPITPDNDTDALSSLPYLPNWDAITVNNAMTPGFPHVTMSATESGDCDDLPTAVYWIEDDDGSCTDTGSDGTLDGGSSTLNDCHCEGGTWTDV